MRLIGREAPAIDVEHAVFFPECGQRSAELLVVEHELRVDAIGDGGVGDIGESGRGMAPEDFLPAGRGRQPVALGLS
ncbi:hypothetical protein D3C83_152320 [compost metagenome]